MLKNASYSIAKANLATREGARERKKTLKKKKIGLFQMTLNAFLTLQNGEGKNLTGTEQCQTRVIAAILFSERKWSVCR